jgi:hypothetical protein
MSEEEIPLQDEIAVSKLSNFEYRMAELEEKVRVSKWNRGSPGLRPASARERPISPTALPGIGTPNPARAAPLQANAAIIFEPGRASGRPTANGVSGRTLPGAGRARRAPGRAGRGTASRPAR